MAAFPRVAVLPEESLRSAFVRKLGWLSSFVSVPAATSTEGLLGPTCTGFSSVLTSALAGLLASSGLPFSTNGLGCGLFLPLETDETLLVREDLSELENLEPRLENQDDLRLSFFDDSLLGLFSSGDGVFCKECALEVGGV